MGVILVFFDTMRYDHAGCYGYPKATTPNVDRLAQAGALFSNCYATDVPTQPCYTATLWGRRGITTGVVSHGQPETTISPELANLPEVLQANGVLTAAVSTLYRFRRWFAKGFTHYIQPDIRTWLQHVTADQVNEQAIPWLRAYGQQEFFLFLHYWDPHTPYARAPKEYVERFYEGTDPYDPENHSLDRLRELPLMSFFISGGAVPELREGLTDISYPLAQYDAEIAYADDRLGQVLETLEELKVLEDTLIIFTSDHGEAFGEHDVYFDHMDAYEQVSHVPLVMWHPERVQPRQIDALVQHIDFAPTILQAFGLAVPKGFEGKSLWPLLRSEEQEHYDAVFTNQGLWSAQRAMRTKQWSLVKTIEAGMLNSPPSLGLFDRQSDPAEAHDVAPDNVELTADLEAQLLRWSDQHCSTRPDPLRLAAQENAATMSVKRRYQEHLARQQAREPGVTPQDRAQIDDRPGR